MEIPDGIIPFREERNSRAGIGKTENGYSGFAKPCPRQSRRAFSLKDPPLLSASICENLRPTSFPAPSASLRIPAGETGREISRESFVSSSFRVFVMKRWEYLPQARRRFTIRIAFSRPSRGGVTRGTKITEDGIEAFQEFDDGEVAYL
jgi:hypothetical protein